MCPAVGSALSPCPTGSVPTHGGCPHVPGLRTSVPACGVTPRAVAPTRRTAAFLQQETSRVATLVAPGDIWGQILHRGRAQIWHPGSVLSPCTGWYHDHQMLIRQLQVIIFHQRKGRPRRREPPGEPSSPLAPPPSPGVARDPRSPSGSAHLPSPFPNPPPLIAAEAWRASGDCV